MLTYNRNRTHLPLGYYVLLQNEFEKHFFQYFNPAGFIAVSALNIL